jgi:hypothetical protein
MLLSALYPPAFLAIVPPPHKPRTTAYKPRGDIYGRKRKREAKMEMEVQLALEEMLHVVCECAREGGEGGEVLGAWSELQERRERETQAAEKKADKKRKRAANEEHKRAANEEHTGMILNAALGGASSQQNALFVTLPTKAAMVRFYEVHNPAKVDCIDAILTHYADRPMALRDRFRQTYGGEIEDSHRAHGERNTASPVA